MKLTKEQIDEIVRLLGGSVVSRDHNRQRLTSAFGERVNPYEAWNGYTGRSGLIPALFDAAAKVADGCDAGGGLLATTFNHESDCAALKKLVEEIRGMA